MFKQVDLFYRPDFSKHTEFNQTIYEYEFKRIQMRLKQVTKLLDEIHEDKQKLIEYKKLENKQKDRNIANHKATKYLVEVAQEETARNLASQSLANYNPPTERAKTPEEKIEYIEGDISLDIDTTVQKCQTQEKDLLMYKNRTSRDT
jgi:hypothetical protein